MPKTLNPLFGFWFPGFWFPIGLPIGLPIGVPDWPFMSKTQMAITRLIWLARISFRRGSAQNFAAVLFGFHQIPSFFGLWARALAPGRVPGPGPTLGPNLYIGPQFGAHIGPQFGPQFNYGAPGALIYLFGGPWGPYLFILGAPGGPNYLFIYGP